MSTDLTIILGVLAAGLQVYAYILYIGDKSIDPNPTTWFMFAYGTSMTVILEQDSDATWPELMLPIVCSFFCIYVTYRCWKKARKINPAHWWPRDWWPEDFGERWSFVSDIVITVGYVVAFALTKGSILTEEEKYWAVLAFLFLSNISTFFQFYPMLHETHLHPERENSKPWLVWAAAYGTLALVTYLTHGEV